MTVAAGTSVGDALSDLARLAIQTRDRFEAVLVEIAKLTIYAVSNGKTLLFCGNGGSAADAQHLAAEYVVRFRYNRRPIRALALTTDTSVLTACANDFSFEQVFARQVEAFAGPGDVLFLHSTSGMSENLVLAARAARDRGARTVALLARDGGRLREEVDHAVVIPTESAAHAQEVHLCLGHAICDLVERNIASPGSVLAHE